ncbi:MAG TPA: UDP-N-acetylmuramoyl-L-alanine--D-glutamate ligase [Firmicutes bacterium]|jgi:UDP-N-acetylmuramoylalanine--D-glutamate ligase|nr:UDP-N-acetylmuramoyl-L-alanine--D-glutamate ligase [Bacillota bacterium]
MIGKIKGKRVLVLGMGKSGRAAVRLLIKAGASSIVANDRKQTDLLLKEAEEFLAYPQVEIVGGGHPQDLLEGVSLIIKSPGISPELPFLKSALDKGIPVYSEIELAYNYTQATIVGITGTNGKTTTTALIGEMFHRQFSGVHVAGNIGFPLCQAAMVASEEDIIVAELSSFQLEDTDKFRVHIGAVLNITPDHLDYHRSVENYIAAKRKILDNQRSDDWIVTNWDDPQSRRFKDYARGKVLPFSRKEELNPGICIQDNTIVINFFTKIYHICSVADVKICGLHNLENALAAVGVAWAAGVGAENIVQTLRSFPGVPHRLEDVAVLSGVKFINDSKGTNPDAVINALRAVRGPKILIAGGKNKGGDFQPLAKALREESVKKLILLGETAPLLVSAALKEGFNNVELVADIKEAVLKAFSSASSGDTVLLSPACASWDMFKNFEQRGEEFKSAVSLLKKGLEKG